jgi:thiol:disulfide interchange protein DsbD
MFVLTFALAAAACGSAADRAASPSPSPPPPAPRKQPRGDELVRLTLLADVTRVAPGQEVTLGARLDIQPGWHVYWVNPGESGLATEAAFTAPSGFRVGAARFPGPARFESPGDITSYGYEELAMVSAVVAAPDSLAGPTVQFSVQASWLACRDICVPGRAVAQIDLDAVRPGEPSQPAHAELFSRHRDALPRPLAELGAAAPTWRRDQQQVSIAIDVRGAERLEYFPASGEDLGLTGQASVPAPGGWRVELSYKPTVRPVRLKGVLAVTRAGGVRYYAMDLEEPSR